MFGNLVKISEPKQSSTHHLVQGGRGQRVNRPGAVGDSAPLRGAVYARFSTGMQKEESIERQTELCLDWAHRNNVAVDLHMIFVDRAHSGKLMIAREGLSALMQVVKEGGVDIVIFEDHDRLSRDLGHSGHIFNTAVFHDTLLASTKRGVLDSSDIAIFGYLSAEQREQLSRRIRDQKVIYWKKGSWQGRPPYGYAVVPGSPGELAIVPEQAAIVSRAFELRLNGVLAAEIARIFNAEGVPCPHRHGRWIPSHISRWSTRAGGLLRNPLYVGECIQGLIEIKRAPDTEKRRTRFRPSTEGVTTHREDLRIVSDETYFGVAALLQNPKRKGARAQGTAPASHLFAGLLRCGLCAELSLSGPRNLQVAAKQSSLNRRHRCVNVDPNGRPFCRSTPPKEHAGSRGAGSRRSPQWSTRSGCG